MKHLRLTIVTALLMAIVAADTLAAQGRSLRGGGLMSRRTLRLSPGITKNSARLADRSGAVMETLGGSDSTEDAVKRALDWFVKKQQRTGHWEETKSPIAHTGLVMMCFYSYGASHSQEGPYKETVAKALEWLLTKVQPDGRMMDGGRMYDQTIGTLALAEAYGASKDERIKEPLEKAIKFICEAQNPRTGGWRYAPYREKVHDGDLSVSGWAIMALASAQISGVAVPQDVRIGGLNFLDLVGSGKQGGMFGYRTPQPNPTMTSVGMYSYELFAGAQLDDRLEESVAYMMAHLPDEKQENFYYWYYGTLALNLYGGDGWEAWNSRMTPLLLRTQEEDGSWSPVGKRAKEEGRVVTTAWATLSLEVYYRYTPLGRIPTQSARGVNLSLQTKPAGVRTHPTLRATAGRPQ
tara:strand:+ start:16925 stop:18148 length:1224 start_codon:yes stop_codon:yes gene_type:complete